MLANSCCLIKLRAAIIDLWPELIEPNRIAEPVMILELIILKQFLSGS